VANGSANVMMIKERVNRISFWPEPHIDRTCARPGTYVAINPALCPFLFITSCSVPMASNSPLFQPSDAESSATFRFLRRVNSLHGLDLQSYLDLYQWSTAHLDAFWGMVWDQTNVIGDKASHVVDNDALPPMNPLWYAYS